MQLTNIDNLLKKIAGFLGLLQGLAWIMMSLAIIIVHATGYGDYAVPSSYMDYVKSLMYYFFVAGEGRDSNSTFVGGLITPEGFLVFIYVYLILDFCWIVASILVMNTSEPNQAKTKNHLRIWSILTLIISAVDLLLVIMIAAHYSRCLTYAKSLSYQIQGEAGCANGMLPVLVIAAKGFVLWIVNVTFAGILIKMARLLSKEPVPQEFTTRTDSETSNVAVESIVTEFGQHGADDLPNYWNLFNSAKGGEGRQHH